jgi:hypothetical protein
MILVGLLTALPLAVLSASLDRIIGTADCQRAVKTSHEWALENQPL